MKLLAWFRKTFRGDRILILILLLAFSIRVFGLGAAPFFDEAVWRFPVEEMLKGSLQSYIYYIPHPPLSVLLFSVFAFFGGVSINVLRSMPLFIGLITIIVSYYFAKSLYNRRAAVISALIMAVIFYPVWMSLWIDSDGSVLTLFLIASLFSFHKLEKTSDKRWLLAAGVFFGLALLSKYVAVLLIPVLLLYDFVSNRLKNLKLIAASAVIGLVVFSIFPLLAFMFNSPDTFMNTLGYGARNLGRSDVQNVFYSYALSLGKLFVFLFQYGTPILCLLPLYSLRKSEKREYILFSFAIIILVFYAFVIPGGSKARYIMPAVPALAILASKSISEIFRKFDRNDASKFICLFAAALALLSLLNAYGTQEAFNSQKLKPSLLLQNSMFWYSGFASVPFAIHVHSLIFVIAASIALFLLSLKFGKFFVIALISLGLAFNFFILFQSFNPTVGPDFTRTVSQMVEYYKAGNFNCTLYSTEKTFMFYLNDVEFYETLQKGLKGCVLTMNVQDFYETETFKNAFETCKKINPFYSNGFDIGRFYICG